MPDTTNAEFGARVQLIVDVLAQSLDRAVLLDDDSMTPITFSRQRGQLDDVRMYSLLERATKPEVQAEFQAMGILTSTDAMPVPPLPEFGMVARFCVPICSETERFGYLWVMDPEQSLPESGQALARQAGRDLQTVLDRRNAALRAVESSQHALFMRLLSASTAEAVEPVLGELRARNIAAPDSQLSVFAFHTEPEANSDPIERAMSLRLRLTTTEWSHHWFTLPGKPSAIFAVSRPETPVDPGRLTETVLQALDATYGHRPAVGWSGDRVPLAQVARVFRHARLAWNLATIGASNEAVAVWTELGSWKTVAVLADNYSNAHGDLAELVNPGIRGLLDQGRDDLIHTLEVYLANGGDAQRTAKNLHLHRSTLYYRLEKITEAVGGDLSDGETRFELMLGLRLALIAGLYRSNPTVV